MKHQKLWAVVVVGLSIAAIVAAYWVLDPSLWASGRLQRLESAKSPAEILEAARPLLLEPDPAAQDLLAKYASSSPLRLYDRKQNLLAFYEPSTGALHSYSARASVVFNPKVKIQVKELRVVESTPEAVSFVAIAEDHEEMQLFINRGMQGFIEPGVTPQRLAALQKTGVYRHYAEQIGPP